MKSLGACAILLASLSFGLLCQRERRRRLASLREIEEALRLMAGELSLRAVSMLELLQWMAEQSRGSAGLFFRCLSQAMPRLGETSFSALWDEAAEYCFPELSRQDRDELKRVGRMLGRFELSEQLSGLKSSALRISSRLERAEEGYRRESKLLLCLPTAAGCLLILLLL